MKDERNNLDRLLDEALAGYSNAEPWPGLENRILNRIRSAGAVGPKRPWLWSLSAAVAIGALVLILWWPALREASPVPVQKAPVIARVEQGAKPVLDGPALIRRRARAPRRVAPRPELPKLDQFPSQSALTREELTLLSLVRRDPVQAQQIAAELSRNGIEAIHFEEVQIKPLENGN